MNSSKIRIAIFSVLGVALALGILFLYQTGRLSEWFSGASKAEAAAVKYEPPKLLELGKGEFGLQLSKAAIDSLELNPQAAELAKKDLPLPPMIGTVNYDNDRLFSIMPLFTGKVTKIRPVGNRPIKFGDNIQQGQWLAVFKSRDLGEKKAALVDAILSLRLSQKTLERHRELYKEGAISYATLAQSERQVQQDSNAMMTAERTLRMWEISEAEIKEITTDANTIHDQKLKRDLVKEVEKWSHVELKVPEFDPKNPERKLTILEKNINLGSMVDPANYNTPPFRVADLSRLQIWVHPPEEYLPILRKQMEKGPGALKWQIRFQSEAAKKGPSEPAKKDPLKLAVEQISPSLEPNQHTPMLIGYLENPQHTYLIGQFVTATIMVRPPEDTVEIPTDAVNPLNGQEFVFIENPKAKDQFLIRRVSVVQSLKKTSYVRTKLEPEQEQINLAVKVGEYRIQALKAGDRVVTRGVVELTAALEELRNAKKLSR